jgi:endonuclease YncB( thermonuclease family)
MQELMQRAIAALLAPLIGVAVLSGVAGASSPFVQRGTVVSILDPGSISVRLSDGTTEQVELFGITPPDPGSCDFSQALADTTSLALGQGVWLVVAQDSSRHGRSRMLLAYAVLSGGADLGLDLVQRGDAKVRADHHPFKQLASYLRAQSRAQSIPLGLWACASSTTGTKKSHSAPPSKHGSPSTTPGPPSMPPGQEKKSSTSDGQPDDQGSGQGGHGSHGSHGPHGSHGS